ATKSGFSTDQTYPIGGAAGTDPISPDATVVVQQVTQTSLLIDRVSSFTVQTVDSSCVVLPNIDFSLTGTKIIGAPSILKYDTHNFSTGSSGNVTIQDLEADTYETVLTSISYDLSGTSFFPIFTINPNENKTLQMVAVPHAGMALLVSVKDSADLPINGATVQLEKGEFNEIKSTNSSPCQTPGQTFWNNLASGSYTLTVSKIGYQTSVSTIDVLNNWQNQNIILTP
ncbi:TPA: hypothetical protein DHT69_01815, partial [Candidatus Collierbacteria bacterium]|nr:hypothetical protein [Candidatus Collierbacteria bacterium]